MTNGTAFRAWDALGESEHDGNDDDDNDDTFATIAPI